MSRSVVIICGLYVAYGSAVTTLWLVEEETPPAVINLLIVAAAVLGAVVCVVQVVRHYHAAVEQLRAELRALRKEMHPPHRSYVVPAQRDGEGLGPQAIQALRRIDRRLNGEE